MAYLDEHPPARRQFHSPRRAQATGAVGVHTAENMPDLVLPDNGAEAVAAYISARPTAGSYHDVVDADSIVNVVSYGDEAFHDGTGGNRWSLSLSFACRADQWDTLPDEWVEAALRNGAEAARRQSAYVQHITGSPIPARRITAAQYRSGIAGFVAHGQLDPGRRSDPGDQFPWTRFLELYINPTPGDFDPMGSLRAFIDASFDSVSHFGDAGGRAYWVRTAAAERPDANGWSWNDCLASPALGTMVALLLAEGGK